MSEKTRKIGIMGGTFDPIHNGHLYIAEKAREEYHLDEVWFMPAGNPYFKSGKQVTDASLRFHMTQLAVSGTDAFLASDYELRQTGNTYTANTMRALHAAYPADRFFFLIGADSLFALPTWYDPEGIFQNCTILCAGREGSEETDAEIARLNLVYREAQADIRRIHCSEMKVSSTEIRKKIGRGEDVSSFLPSSVLDFIRQQGLYRPR